MSGRGWQVPGVRQPMPAQYSVLRQSSLSPQPPVEAHSPTEATRMPAEAASQSLLYVLPSQPQTGAQRSMQASGIVSQVPAVSQPMPAQYWPRPQSPFERQSPVVGHSPLDAAFCPAAFASHSLPYVMPSQPQTGS